VKKGVHTVAITLEAQKDESTESLQPKVMALAKMALARLPQGVHRGVHTTNLGRRVGISLTRPSAARRLRTAAAVK